MDIKEPHTNFLSVLILKFWIFFHFFKFLYFLTFFEFFSFFNIIGLYCKSPVYSSAYHNQYNQCAGTNQKDIVPQV
jgi:hypothetical protein